jgi:SET domain-containing protein
MAQLANASMAKQEGRGDAVAPSLPLRTCEIKMTPKKGRGVFALLPVTTGQVIDSSPVLVIPSIYYDIVKGFPFISHTFVWRDNRKNRSHKSGAIVFGAMSFCNHANSPNAKIVKNYSDKIMYLKAIRPIAAGEEITIRYKNVWFQEAA